MEIIKPLQKSFSMRTNEIEKNPDFEAASNELD